MKVHAHKTKVANTLTHKERKKKKKKKKKNYASKVIKLRFLSQIIELADKYVAKEHLAVIPYDRGSRCQGEEIVQS